MFHDRHVRSKQPRVDRPGPILEVVDVQRIDPEKDRSPTHNPLRSGLRKVWVSGAVLWRAEVAGPAGVDQNRAALELQVLEKTRRNRALAMSRVHDDTSNIRDSVQRERR